MKDDMEERKTMKTSRRRRKKRKGWRLKKKRRSNRRMNMAVHHTQPPSCSPPSPDPHLPTLRNHSKISLFLRDSPEPTITHAKRKGTLSSFLRLKSTLRYMLRA